MSAESPYWILALIAAFDIAVSPYRLWDCNDSGKLFFFLRPAVGCWSFGYVRYSQRTLSTAGLLVQYHINIEYRTLGLSQCFAAH